MLKRALLATAATGVALGAALGCAWWQLVRRPLPKTSGALTLDGIEGPVEVRRDRWGVPHVRATTTRDLWFGQGFCHGQDRLWQLDLYRRVADGRLAAIAGREALAADRLMRTLGLRQVAEHELEALPDDVRAAIEALCDGINAAAEAATPPFELQLLRLGFEPYEPVDVLAAQKLISLGLSTNWEHELLRADMAREVGPELAARLDPTYPPTAPLVLDPGATGPGQIADLATRIDQIRRYLGMTVEATGSNNWAISGERSATGSPLLAGDPHLAPSMPGVMYQIGLELGDRFLRGASLPGTPGIALGQGNDVCWSLTNVMADVMDLFVERIEGDRYLFAGDWRELEVREELIEVRGSESPERLLVRCTHHGPIVNEALRADDAEPLALSWAALRFPAVTRANICAIEARNGPELAAMMRDHATPASNMVWADSAGAIGYKAIGRIPTRAGGSPDLPRCGWSGDDEWTGWIPHDELPELVNPERGYVITANNRIAPEDYPHHLTSEYLDGSRAQRIQDLIERAPDHDVNDFARMQLDLFSIPGIETVRRLARLEPRGQAELSAVERLRSWDGRMSPNSVAATIYQAFTLRFGREVARRAIGDRDLTERWLGRADNGFMTHVLGTWRWQSHLLALWDEADPGLIGGSWDELALDALRGAVDDLAGRFGPDPERWRWGAAHRLEFPHALGQVHPLLALLLNRSVEVGGAQETVAQVGWEPSRPFTATWAPCWRLVADPADPSRSRWQQFTGNSGHVGSTHYDDLQPRWRDGLTQPLEGEGPWRVLRLEPGQNATRPLA